MRAARPEGLNLNEGQLRVLRHMLGIDDPLMRSHHASRDYYCANPGDEEMHGLLALGAVRMYSRRDGYEWFTTTVEGREAAFASHRRIRKPKGARLYSTFLQLRDCWPDLTFKAFLTRSDLRDTRRAA